MKFVATLRETHQNLQQGTIWSQPSFSGYFKGTPGFTKQLVLHGASLACGLVTDSQSKSLILKPIQSPCIHVTIQCQKSVFSLVSGASPVLGHTGMHTSPHVREITCAKQPFSGPDLNVFQVRKPWRCRPRNCTRKCWRLFSLVLHQLVLSLWHDQSSLQIWTTRIFATKRLLFSKQTMQTGSWLQIKSILSLDMEFSRALPYLTKLRPRKTCRIGWRFYCQGTIDSLENTASWSQTIELFVLKQLVCINVCWTANKPSRPSVHWWQATILPQRQLQIQTAKAQLSKKTWHRKSCFKNWFLFGNRFSYVFIAEALMWLLGTTQLK